MQRHKETAYALLRLTIGFMFLFYGVNKFLRGLDAVASGMVNRMARSPLPDLLVQGFATVLPIVEVILGTLLVLGLFTRHALAAAGVLMIVLTVGVVLEPNPAAVAQNVNYALVLFILLWLAELNHYSLDGFWSRRGSREGARL